MLYCPKCKSEYRDGFTKCADCDVRLIDSLQETSVPQEEMETDFVGDLVDEVLLINLSGYVEYSYIISMLDQEGIPYVIKVGGLAQYMKFYSGYDFTGKDIYVGRADYDRAVEVIDSAKLELPEDEDVEDIE